jgi:hypothetical protein
METLNGANATLRGSTRITHESCVSDIDEPITLKTSEYQRDDVLMLRNFLLAKIIFLPPS